MQVSEEGSRKSTTGDRMDRTDVNSERCIFVMLKEWNTEFVLELGLPFLLKAFYLALHFTCASLTNAETIWNNTKTTDFSYLFFS